MIGTNIGFKLSQENLNDIPFEKYHTDFTFIVNGKRYETTRIIADILSPYLRKLHYMDQTINEYSFNTKSDNNLIKEDEDYFSEFLNLIQFKEVLLDPSRKNIFSQYFSILGNFKEYIRLYAKTNVDNENEALDRLIAITNFIDSKQSNQEYVNESEIEQLVDIISINFNKLDKEKMKLLKIDLIEEIIRNDKLQIENEDSLFNFIYELYNENHENGYLFEYVYFNGRIENIC